MAVNIENMIFDNLIGMRKKYKSITILLFPFKSAPKGRATELKPLPQLS